MPVRLQWQSEDVIRAVRGKSSGTPNWQAQGVSIDSRSVQPGDLFVALKGPAHDGHDFVADALKAGAVAAIVSRQPKNAPESAPLILVEDTMTALEGLGRAGRARARGKIVAVTGSVGKTGTKEMLRLMLSACGAAYANEGSFNNQWGVPLSLARMPADAQFGVFELGMNHAGELGPLSQQVQPHIALITNVEAVHLEFFPSVEAIADAKSEIFLGMNADGIAVLNRDNPHFERLDDAACARGLRRILSFSRDKKAEARLVSCKASKEGSEIEAEILGRPVRYRLGASGEHLALNSAGALLAAAMADADLDICAAALEHYQPPKGRGAAETLSIPGGEITLIDESYNASPAAVRAAIRVLSDMTPGPNGRRIMALGDMRELGGDAPALHAALARDLGESKIGRVHCCGEMMKHLYDSLPPNLRGFYAPDSAALASRVAADLRAGDIITVKGSKAVKMPAVIEAIRALDRHAHEKHERTNGRNLLHIALIVFSLVALCSPAFADDLLARNWSVTDAHSLDKYTPTPAEVTKLVNDVIDADWTMNVCSYKFIDVYDGTLRLVASLDVNGRHFCNEVVVLEKNGSHANIVNKLNAVGADNVGDMLSDVDGDHSPELVVTQAWSKAETGRCQATWQKTFKWSRGRFADQSASFPDAYKARREGLAGAVAHEPDPSCDEMEIDRIDRLLGAPKAGFDRAAGWMKSPDGSLRRKAAAVFADIGDESSKKNLALLAQDADPLVAESARLYLEAPSPDKE